MINRVSRRSRSFGGTSCQLTFDIYVRALGELASLMPELNLTALIAMSPARVFIAV